MVALNRTTLKQNPIARAFLVNPKRRLKILSTKLLIRSRTRYWFFHDLPNEDEIFWVSPQEIVWHTNLQSQPDQSLRNRTFDMFWDKGKILEGDWDTGCAKFDDLAASRSITSRILNKTDWKDTEFFQECMEDIKAGRKLWHCHDETSLLKRLGSVDAIAENMRSTGYKAGYESCLMDEDMTAMAKHPKYSEEITVNIGRTGEFYFQDGRHRLAIAKALNVERVAVKVLVRHIEWCRKLKSLTIQEANRQGLTQHPDVQYLLRNGSLHRA